MVSLIGLYFDVVSVFLCASSGVSLCLCVCVCVSLLSCFSGWALLLRASAAPMGVPKKFFRRSGWDLVPLGPCFSTLFLSRTGLWSVRDGNNVEKHVSLSGDAQRNLGHMSHNSRPEVLQF